VILLAQDIGRDVQGVVVPFALLCTGVGLLFVFLGIRTLRSSRRFRSRALRAPGVVTDVRYEVVGTDADSGMWFPVLRFATADGRTVDTTAMYGRSPAPARRGDVVSVLYDPTDPTRAAIDGPIGGGGLIGSIFLGLGLIFALLGLGAGAVLAFVSTR